MFVYNSQGSLVLWPLFEWRAVVTRHYSYNLCDIMQDWSGKFCEFEHNNLKTRLTASILLMLAVCLPSFLPLFMLTEYLAPHICTWKAVCSACTNTAHMCAHTLTRMVDENNIMKIVWSCWQCVHVHCACFAEFLGIAQTPLRHCRDSGYYRYHLDTRSSHQTKMVEHNAAV